MLGSSRRAPVRAAEALRSAVVRSFKGGLNTYDPPLNLSSQFVTEARNMYPDTSGTLRVRFGTSLFSDLSGVGDDIIGMEYYINVLVCVFQDGRICKVDSDGVAAPIWSNAIAAMRPGAPNGWTSGIRFVSFTQFNGELIVCNGVDKPLVVDNTITVNYLSDIGSGSNVNVPRAKYCVTHNDYLILAVTPNDRTTLYITSKGTSGTFAGDPPPNDAVNFNTGVYLVRGVAEITGLGSFRNRMVVTFDENLMAVQLGEYNDVVHVPKVEDVIENFGTVSHRCIVPMGDDVLFLDKVGIASVARALVTATLSPTRESLLVSRDLQKALKRFSTAELSDQIFAIHDRIASQVLFFMPKQQTPTVVVEQPNTAWNALTKQGDAVLSEADKRATVVAASQNSLLFGTNPIDSALGEKKYLQFAFTTIAGTADFGFAKVNATYANMVNNMTNGFGHIGTSQAVNGSVVGGNLGNTANKVYEFCVDFANQRFWVRHANADGSSPTGWNNSGTANPSTNVGGNSLASLGGGVFYPAYASTNQAGQTFDVKLRTRASEFGALSPPVGYTAYDPEVAAPPTPLVPATQDNDVYVLCMDKTQKFRAMTYFDAMPYRCGARSGDGRVFFGTGATLYYYRNQYEPLWEDQAIIGSQAWSDSTFWSDGTGWVGSEDEPTYNGAPIFFAAATPWSDMREPDKQKDCRYLHCVMEGEGVVNVEMYADRFDAVQLGMTFTMTDTPTSPMLVNRPLNNDQLYAWNAKFTRARLRVSGSTKNALSLLSLGVLYLLGGFRR